MIDSMNRKKNLNVTKLILIEIIEGFVPIIYGACMAVAYYGPNAHILATVGNNYWSKEMEDIGYLFLVMFGLFAFDTLSAGINSFCLWKIVNINMAQEFCRMFEQYWFFMAVKLSYNMSMYFAPNDVNSGMDRSKSFQWTSDEGWRNLVNSSKDLSNEEKTELIGNVALQWATMSEYDCFTGTIDILGNKILN